MSATTSEHEIDREHYRSDRYLSEYRWASYWAQIECVLDNVGDGGVLEIGVGNGTVSEFLGKLCPVTTFDVNPDLGADIVGDVRHIDSALRDRKWEVVLCAEVLEHLPFDDFVPTLRKLSRHVGKALVLGLPHSGPSLSFWVKLPLLPPIRRAFKIPFPITHPSGRHHFWEVGKRGYSGRRIQRAIEEAGFTINKTYVVPGSPYHRMFVLEPER